MTDLALRDDRASSLLPSASETGLDLPSDLSEGEWREVGEKLGRFQRASAWWVGDWINYGESKWGEKYEEAQRVTGLSYGYLSDSAAVAKRFPFPDRSGKLSWTHHLRAKALPNPEEALARAEAGNWTVRQLQDFAKEPSTPPKRYELQSEYQHQRAAAAKERIERAVGSCNGLARGLDELNVELGILVASDSEMAGWDSSFRDAVAAIKRLRQRIKEAR